MHPHLSVEIARSRRADRMTEANRRNALAGARRRRHPCEEKHSP